MIGMLSDKQIRGRMNRNNIFVKFARFYLANFRSIKNWASGFLNDVWLILPDIWEVIVDFLWLVLHIILVFLPIWQIYYVIISRYLAPEEIKRLTGRGIEHGAYCRKKEIKEMEAEYKARLDAKASAAPIAGENVC